MVKQKKFRCSVFIALFILLFNRDGIDAQAAETYYAPRIDNFAIELPLNGLQGNPSRGQQIVTRLDKGNCLACHSMPITREAFHGTIGPPLHGLASRRTEGQVRLHIVDQQKINPATIMPGFYKNPQELNLVLDEYYGKTFLSAQEVEDVVAYLMTLE